MASCHLGLGDVSLGLQPYPQKVVRLRPRNPPQSSSQEAVGALGFDILHSFRSPASIFHRLRTPPRQPCSLTGLTRLVARRRSQPQPSGFVGCLAWSIPPAGLDIVNPGGEGSGWAGQPEGGRGVGGLVLARGTGGE